MRNILILIFFITATLGFAETAPDHSQHSGHQHMTANKDSNAKLQTSCPVLGNPIDKKIFVDYKGNRIYFCCEGCVADFNKDPEKYMKKMKDEKIVLEKTPKKK